MKRKAIVLNVLMGCMTVCIVAAIFRIPSFYYEKNIDGYIATLLYHLFILGCNLLYLFFLAINHWPVGVASCLIVKPGKTFLILPVWYWILFLVFAFLSVFYSYPMCTLFF